MTTPTSSHFAHQDSGIVEYYTPRSITDAARATMNGIDLDPASCAQANLSVGATRYYTLEGGGGLEQPWWGRVWMNHPFGRKTNAPWVNRLIRAYESCEINQACCITFASTSEKWFKPLMAYPQCFLNPRTNYLDPQGQLVKGVGKGSVVTYLGLNLVKFKQQFSTLGVVKVAV